MHAGTHTPLGRHHPRTVHAGRYGEQVSSTHPTGMHTCVEDYFCCRVIFFCCEMIPQNISVNLRDLLHFHPCQISHRRTTRFNLDADFNNKNAFQWDAYRSLFIVQGVSVQGVLYPGGPLCQGDPPDRDPLPLGTE